MGKQIVELKGIAWDHQRATRPFAGIAASLPGGGEVQVRWDVRSLHDFETGSVEELASKYDMVMIDHPTLGRAVDSNSLIALEELFDAEVVNALARDCVGKSFESYSYHGRRWAVPIDAAAQVLVYRSDRLDRDELPETWEDVLRLSQSGLGVALPLKGSHGFLSVVAMAHAQGRLGADRDVWALERWVDSDGCEEAIEVVRRLVEGPAFEGLESGPIAVYELMAESRISLCPAMFGYVTYASQSWSGLSTELDFANAPRWAKRATHGSVLGGVGLAVSRASKSVESATRILETVMDPRVQSTVIGPRGGQPPGQAWWSTRHLQSHVDSFYHSTRKTLDQAWIRPAIPGYAELQLASGMVIGNGLARRWSSRAIATELRTVWEKHLHSAATSHGDALWAGTAACDMVE